MAAPRASHPSHPRVLKVTRGSPASRAGVRPGDRLMACCGERVEDWLCFAVAASGRVRIDLLVERRGGIVRHLRLSRQPGAEWGLVLSGQAPGTCKHRCIFCFVDQLPEQGLRPDLYVRDDDILHSFYYGNFVSLDPGQAAVA
ncbi:hypothetical protein JW921_10235, partial [Candidatus Fermentibacterales bacterium]|nr:hypothetical protein [Candidatus Fermentibacterales bacterium]